MVTRGSDNPFPSVLFVEHVDPSNPSAGTQRLFVDTDHVLKLIDSSGTVTTFSGSGFSDPMTTRGDIIIRNASNVTARLGRGSANQVLTSDGTDIAWQTPASGGGTDPIADVFGTPDTAYEFASSSLTGLTALNTPVAEDANTTVPDHYYIGDNTSTTKWFGRYQSIPSYPFTAMTKITDFNAKANYNSVGIFLSVSTPGKMIVLELAYATGTRGPTVELFTNPTTYSSTVVTSQPQVIDPPYYLAVVATSTSNTTWYLSMGGYVWTRVLSAYDPSMTIGSVGLCFKAENSGGAAAAFDWFRIWNSAKTFLTGI